MSINRSSTAELLEFAEKGHDDEGVKNWSADSIIVLGLLTIAMCVTIFGNGLVLIAWLRHQSIRVPQNVFIVSLAFVDFLVGLIIFPLDILREVAPLDNLLFCKFRLVAIVGLCTVSIFTWLPLRGTDTNSSCMERRTYREELRVPHCKLWLGCGRSNIEEIVFGNLKIFLPLRLLSFGLLHPHYWTLKTGFLALTVSGIMALLGWCTTP